MVGPERCGILPSLELLREFCCIAGRGMVFVLSDNIWWFLFLFTLAFSRAEDHCVVGEDDARRIARGD
jgi:hypothetical protein